MKVCLISDTHGKHNDIKMPDADMVIHSGDISGMGRVNEVAYFLQWFSKLKQYKYKVFIAGNHDFLFEANPDIAKLLVPNNVVYLHDSWVKIKNLKIYGSPDSGIFYNWAFNKSESDLDKSWSKIPDDVDILVTHTAPHSILDPVDDITRNNKDGSPSLYNHVKNRIKPKLHVFGHFHMGYGRIKFNDTLFVNASILNDDYDIVNEPVVVEI